MPPVQDQFQPHFITMTVVDWVDVFTRDEYRNVILETFHFYRRTRGLKVYAFVIMSNHIHAIVCAENGNLSDILRDFKRWTCRTIIKSMKSYAESRREWMLPIFRKHGLESTRHTWNSFWRKGNYPVILYTPWFAEQKLNYIHMNPVKAGWVESPEDFPWSSARYFHTNDHEKPLDPWPFAPAENRRG